MRYWQITTRRLSRAAQKLTMDDAWHPFASSPLSWYRVWQKKLVQRVTFGTIQEESDLLPLMRPIEPLPDLATVAGFREELNIIQIGDDTFAINLPLGYPPASLDAFEDALAAHGAWIEIVDRLMYGVIPLSELTRASLIRSIEQQMAVRLLYQAVSASADAKSLDAAREGFGRMMNGNA